MKHLAKEAKDDPSKDFLTVNGTGTGHDLKSCKLYDDDFLCTFPTFFLSPFDLSLSLSPSFSICACNGSELTKLPDGLAHPFYRI